MDNYLAYFKNKTILITGSNGFIGKNLIDRLISLQTRIIGIDINNQNKDITSYNCDLREFSQLKKIIDTEKPEIVFNLASIVTATRDYSLYLNMLDINVKVLYYLYSILREKDNLKLLVNIGSSEEYGSYNGLPCREVFFEKTLSPYAASKTAGTHFSYMIGKNEKFPIITLRPGVLFGSYQSDQKFIPYIIKQLLADKKLNLTRCEQTRDFISINQFLEIILLLISSERYNPGEIYNIASGISISLKEIVLYLKNHLNSHSQICFASLPYRKNEIMNLQISVDKVKSIVDFTITKDDIMKELLKLVSEIKMNNEM